MKILYLVWESLGGRHLLNALKKKEYEVDLYPFSKEDGITPNETFTLKFAETILGGNFDYVFSFNYFPMVAVACKACKTTYVSWVYDNPCIELYSQTIKFETNRVFLFDSSEYAKLSSLGVTTVRYLPLASAPEYYMEKIRVSGDTDRYNCDIAFVGATKTEAGTRFNRFESLDAYTKGFLNGIIQSQKSIYGASFLEDLITPELLEKLKAACPVRFDNNSFATEPWFFANYYLYQKLTGIERSEILEALSEKYDVNLYTLEPTPDLPKIHNMGEVNYYDEAPLAFNFAKINLNITLKSITSGIPLRALDIMASMGFLLTNFQGDFGMHFIADEDYVFYDSYKDLYNKVDYYLSHSKERLEIAENGYRKICESHTYENRIDELFPLK